EEGAVTGRGFLGGGPKAVFGEDDADVGHGGLGEDAGDIVMLEGIFEDVEIVEFDHAGGFGGIDGWADVAAARADDAVFKRGEGFVYGAVIAIVEDEDFRTLGDFACDSNGEAVGVSSGECELSVWQAGGTLEILDDPKGVIGGEP